MTIPMKSFISFKYWGWKLIKVDVQFIYTQTQIKKKNWLGSRINILKISHDYYEPWLYEVNERDVVCNVYYIKL